MFGSEQYFHQLGFFVYDLKRYYYNDRMQPLIGDFRKYVFDSFYNTVNFMVTYYDNPSIKLDEDDLITLIDIYIGMKFETYHKEDLEELLEIYDSIKFYKEYSEQLFELVEECYNRAFVKKHVPQEYKFRTFINCDQYEFVNKPKDNPEDEIWKYMQYQEIINTEVYIYGTIKHQRAILRMKKFFLTYGSQEINEFYKNYQKLCYIRFYERYSRAHNIYRQEVYTIVQYLKRLNDQSVEALDHMIALFNKEPFPGNFPRKKYLQCKAAIVETPITKEESVSSSTSSRCFVDFMHVMFKCPTNIDLASDIYQEFCKKFEEVYDRYKQYENGENYPGSDAWYIASYLGSYEKFKSCSYENLYATISQYMELKPGEKLRFDDDAEYLSIIMANLPKDNKLYPFVNEAYRRVTGQPPIEMDKMKTITYRKYMNDIDEDKYSDYEW
jgi:hypothetical protein